MSASGATNWDYLFRGRFYELDDRLLGRSVIPRRQSMRLRICLGYNKRNRNTAPIIRSTIVRFMELSFPYLTSKAKTVCHSEGQVLVARHPDS